MSWLDGLPSGAWAVIGAVVAGLISWVAVVWQNHAQAKRDERARSAFVADRTRDERRTAYAALLLSARKADAAVSRHFNEEQFNFGYQNSPGIENFDLVWEKITGDLSEHVALARLVGSNEVRQQIDVVVDFFTYCVLGIAETGKRPSPTEDPVKALEDLLASELDYRDLPEAESTATVGEAGEEDAPSLAEKPEA